MVSNTYNSYSPSGILRFLPVLWIFSAFFAGCMDPSFYEDPPQSDVVLGDVIAADDEGSAQSVSDAEGDVGAEALDAEESTDGQETEDDVAEPADECECRFDLESTSPLPQSYVWLTGDFVTPPWSMDITAGAVEMALDPVSGDWIAEVGLSHGQTVKYKYLVGWTDNPGPIWGNDDADYSPEAQDSTLFVVCGQDPCNED